MAFPFSSHLIIHARLAKPCRHKKRRKKKQLVLCFSNSCHFDCLLAVSLDNLPATETNPIGRSAPVRSKRERREHSRNLKWNSGMGGEREHREKKCSCQASVPQEKRKSYVAHPKLSRQTRKWTSSTSY